MNNPYNIMREYCDGELTLDYCPYTLEDNCPKTCDYSKLNNLEELAKEREDCITQNKKNGMVPIKKKRGRFFVK